MGSSGLLLGVLATALITLASTTPLKYDDSFAVKRNEIVYRLPTTIIPTHYDIKLVPYFTASESSFTGQVTTDITVTSITNVIIVHSDGLNIDKNSTTVYSVASNTFFNISTQSYDSVRQFFVLTFMANLPIGEYIVTFSFDGKFATDAYGFYRSSYRVGDETRWLVTTQFQPTAARRAFPCFDEPGLKANFSIRIAHFNNQTALSNMPQLEISAPDNAIDDRVWTQFKTTFKMSTYLLAFVVSDFQNVSSVNEFFGIWSQPEAINNTAWALESSQALYAVLLNTVSNVAPWPKIDQVAVPEVLADAVENWGLITYKEDLLLWQEGESNLRSREVIASTISHELAHIWFGNLISPKWWDHLWFIEGFASFYEYIIPSLAYPEWRFAHRIVTDLQLPAMIIDSLEATRPMTNVVGSPDSIQESFDYIASAKGAAVIRMLNIVMRQELFSEAVANFVEESAFGTFEPDTLWRHMQAVADSGVEVQNHMPIKEIMDSWITQAGYPLLTVSRNYSTMVAVFSQERFFLNPNSPIANPESQRWWIPITFTTEAAPSACNNPAIQRDWLRIQDKALTTSNIANHTWILANCQAIGFYRTNYDTRNWELLTAYLNTENFTLINAINRAVLIDDSLNLARAGYIDYSIPLNLISYLVNETDFVVWRAVIPVLSYLNKVLANDEYFYLWQFYLRSLVSDLYQSLGWVANTADDHETRLQRAQILDWACQLDIAEARSSAEARFNSWIANPQLNPIDPDLRSVAYCWGIRTATESTWSIMWSRFLSTDLATEADLILQGLGCSRNSTILEKYLQLTITPDSGIRSQDRFTIFKSIVNSDHDNVDTILNFVANNVTAISEFYGGFTDFANILYGISSRITRQDQLDKFRALVNSNAPGASSSVIERALQIATGNLEWISNKLPLIHDWLHSQDFDFGITTDSTTNSTIPEVGTTVTSTTIWIPPPSGGATFTSSLVFIFTSAMIVMNNLMGA